MSLVGSLLQTNPSPHTYLLLPIYLDDCTLDVTFLLDASDSIGAARNDDYKWNILKEYAAEVTRQLSVSENGVHVAAAKFSEDGEVEFRLDRYDNSRSAANQILRMTLISETSHVDEGIRAVSRGVFGRGGDRDDAPNILVIISDGRFNDLDQAVVAANEAKGRGTIIIPIGAGRDAETSELRSLASRQNEVIEVDEFDDLPTVVDDLLDYLEDYRVDLCPRPGESTTLSEELQCST